MSTDPKLEKIRALLAKAEATDFPEEAASLTAKANELIIRWSIDEAELLSTLEGARDASAADVVTVAEIIIPGGSYKTTHATLANVVAKAYDCKGIIMSKWGGVNFTEKTAYLEVVGFKRDVQAVEILYTSLLMQANHEIAAALKAENRARKVRGERAANRMGFVNAFLVGFTTAVSGRLTAQRASVEATVKAEAADSGATLSLALRDKKRVVTDAFREKHPRTRTTYSRAGRAGSGFGARAAGNAAGHRANLSTGGSALGERKKIGAGV